MFIWVSLFEKSIFIFKYAKANEMVLNYLNNNVWMTVFLSYHAFHICHGHRVVQF